MFCLPDQFYLFKIYHITIKKANVMPNLQVLKNTGLQGHKKRNRQLSDIVDDFDVSFLTV